MSRRVPQLATVASCASCALALGASGAAVQVASASLVASRIYPAGLNVGGIATGDVNRDGRTDVLWIDSGNGRRTQGYLVLRLGSRHGRLGVARRFPLAGIDPTALTLGDFNGDRRLDALVAGGRFFDRGGALITVTNEGRGRFGGAGEGLGVATQVPPAVGDLNGDRRPDLVGTYSYSDQSESGPGLYTVLGLGGGSFSSPEHDPYGSLGSVYAQPGNVALGRFTDDRRLDLAYTVIPDQPTGAGRVFVRSGNGKGRFGPPASYVVSGDAMSVATSDVNGDGRLDLVVSTVHLLPGPVFAQSGSVVVLYGRGRGTFSNAQTVSLSGAPITTPRIVDLNGDCRPDVAIAAYTTPTETASGVEVLLSRGRSGLGRPQVHRSRTRLAIHA